MLRAKFEDCAGRTLPGPRAARLLTLLQSLEQVGDIRIVTSQMAVV